MQTTRSLRISGIASALATMVALACGDSGAVLKTRFYYANATSYCQTALPVFDGNVRKRPLAVQNEGRSNVFVSCAFTAQNTPLDLVALWATNGGDATISLSCTGVTGGARMTTPNQYVTKTITIPASARVGMGWTPSDFGSSSIPGSGYFSVSCELPPGVGINDSYVTFDEDVGA